MQINPTESELEILTILWENGPSTVRDVNAAMNQRRKVGYTTTLKILQIMFEKELVLRDEKERSHKYSANIEKNAIQNRLIDKMLNSAFGGSTGKLVLQALGNHRASPEELKQIRELLDKLDKKEEL